MLRQLAILLLITQPLAGQRVVLDFQPVLQGLPWQVEQHLGADAGAIKVEVLRFYLADLVLLREGEVVVADSIRHHLLDAELPASLQLPLHLPPGQTYDALQFTLGVDSLTSASGVFGGDLDPTRGMYWTWRSGYIHFKLEGTSPDCPARNHRFQFHVGGFAAPFNTTRQIRLPARTAAIVPIKIDLDAFFAAIDLRADYQVMSPNGRALALADLLATIFKVIQ